MTKEETKMNIKNKYYLYTLFMLLVVCTVNFCYCQGIDIYSDIMLYSVLGIFILNIELFNLVKKKVD